MRKCLSVLLCELVLYSISKLIVLSSRFPCWRTLTEATLWSHNSCAGTLQCWCWKIWSHRSGWYANSHGGLWGGNCATSIVSLSWCILYVMIFTKNVCAFVKVLLLHSNCRNSDVEFTLYSGCRVVMRLVKKFPVVELRSPREEWSSWTLRGVGALIITSNLPVVICSPAVSIGIPSCPA